MMHNMAKCLTPILIKTESDREDKLTKRLLYGKKPFQTMQYVSKWSMQRGSVMKLCPGSILLAKIC